MVAKKKPSTDTTGASNPQTATAISLALAPQRAGPPVPLSSRISNAKTKAAKVGAYSPAAVSTQEVLRPQIAKPIQLPVFEHRGRPVADSRDVALFVGKDHAHLLRDIRRYVKAMKKFNESNVGFVGTAEEPANTKLNPMGYFIEAAYIDEKGETRPCFYCTEMGCEMVANKMTGDKGIIFTAQYVKAFHAMRSLLLERASPVWQDTRSLGKEIRRQETEAIKRLVDYAQAQGSRNAGWYYANLSRLADATVGIVERDKAQVVQLTALLLVEQTIAREITAGIRDGIPYWGIYRGIKNRLAAFSAVGALASGEVTA